jgi:hypothetical protein
MTSSKTSDGEAESNSTLSIESETVDDSVEQLSEAYAMYRVFSTEGFVSARISDVFVHGVLHYLQIDVVDENTDLSFYIEFDQLDNIIESYRPLAQFVDERDGTVVIPENNEILIDVEITDEEYTNNYVYVRHPELYEDEKIKFRDSLPDGAEHLDSDQHEELLNILRAAEFYDTKQGRFEAGAAVHLGDIVGAAGGDDQYIEVELPYIVGDSSGYSNGTTTVEIPVPSMDVDLSEEQKGYEFVEYCGGSIDDLAGAYVYISPELRDGGFVTSGELFRVYTKEQFVQANPAIDTCDTCGELTTSFMDGDCEECYTKPSIVDRIMLTTETLQPRAKTVITSYIFAIFFLYGGYLTPAGNIKYLVYVIAVCYFVFSVFLNMGYWKNVNK